MARSGLAEQDDGIAREDVLDSSDASLGQDGSQSLRCHLVTRTKLIPTFALVEAMVSISAEGM